MAHARQLFFLDAEPPAADLARVIRRLAAAGWTRERVRQALVELIAPVAGHNLGFLVWPVVGAWAGFDRGDLCLRIERRARARERWPAWRFGLSDWYCARMLKRLGMDSLLARL